MKATFQTDRLIAVPLIEAHADQLDGLLDQRVNVHFAAEDAPGSLTQLRRQFSEIEAAAADEYGGARYIPLVVKTASDDQPIGRIEALIHGKDAELAFVFVPQSWGQGFASKAVAGLIAHLRIEGIEKFWACVAPTNVASLALYNRMKFEPVPPPVDLVLATFDDGDAVLLLAF